MAICTDCEREMMTADTCTVEAFHRGRQAFPLIPFGDERPRWRGKRCGDCNVLRGGFHHLGCDIARCPSCFGQQIWCGCHFDEWGEEEDDQWADEDDDVVPATVDDRIAAAVLRATTWATFRFEEQLLAKLSDEEGRQGPSAA